MEHYLVHVMRSHEDFIPELDFVMELDGEVMGSIMYTKASLTDEDGVKKEILTFGPVCILSKYQRRGYGKMLIEHSFQTALKLAMTRSLYSEVLPTMWAVVLKAAGSSM